MDGLEAVELRLSEVLEDNLTFRIDSQYFNKEYLKAYVYLKARKYHLNKHISIIKSGSTPRDRDETLKHGTVLLKTNDIRNNILTDEKENFFYIDEKTNTKMKATELKYNDVLINIVGATTDVIGRSSLISKDFPKANITQAMAFSRLYNEDFLPEYLFILLQTYYGQVQVKRLARPTGQYNLNLDEVGRFIIPDMDIEFQNKIKTLINMSHEKLIESKILYKQAENLLLEELGVLGHKPSEKSISVKSFSQSFGSSGRLDSEYYLPKYDEIEEKLSRFEKIKINQLINYPVSSGATPKAGGDAYTDKENGIPFIRAVNIINSQVEFKDALYIKPEVHNKKLKKTQLKENDVLFSIAGTVGRCGISYYQGEANINQAVAILRFDDSIIKRLYLIMFFNSDIGKLYISKYSRQGVQTNLNLDEVSNLEIPILSQFIQVKIEENIKISFALQKESKELLELAKSTVEVAIEEGEEVAMGMINE